MSLQPVITGKAYVLGDNVDTDQIIPAQYLTFNPAIPEEYRQFGKYALSSVPPAQAGLPRDMFPSIRMTNSYPGTKSSSPAKTSVAVRRVNMRRSRSTRRGSRQSWRNSMRAS